MRRDGVNEKFFFFEWFFFFSIHNIKHTGNVIGNINASQTEHQIEQTA